ncbi:hypothetical protein ELZ19_06800 [Brucella abortus]|uniref:hypothetical protein n=1 Tax=Brucella abortus TaxID=235 RepID=UPI0004E9129B|nr:hypothetical protein [Brucella abortus]KFH18412.1 hypothetical protein IB60_17020 [Brucella abortus LMN1]RUQ67358.1 hypothetical protein ELZ23_15635 [Brucella abortus]RUQ78345.1 hypothetical protein ELZ22_17140 [Brucella abortus]RUQ88255.1 hypothetical protein ELZ18_15445 [Brucella abortus]RUQ96522.1 hypothetical protein ELZ21_15545 [Brucella abortus]
MTTKRTVRLEGQALALTADLHVFHKNMGERHREMQARHEAEHKAFHEAHQEEVRARFAAIAEAAGVDDFNPDDNWALDTEYLDEHGVAFMKQQEPEPNPLEALFGGGQPVH